MAAPLLGKLDGRGHEAEIPRPDLIGADIDIRIQNGINGALRGGDRGDHADKVFAVDNRVVDPDIVYRAFVEGHRAESACSVPADNGCLGEHIVAVLLFKPEEFLIEFILILCLLVVDELLSERIHLLLKVGYLLGEGGA